MCGNKPKDMTMIRKIFGKQEKTSIIKQAISTVICWRIVITAAKQLGHNDAQNPPVRTTAVKTKQTTKKDQV